MYVVSPRTQKPRLTRFEHVYERGIIKPYHVALIESMYYQLHSCLQSKDESDAIVNVNPTYLVARLLQWRYGIHYVAILNSIHNKEKKRAVEERITKIINMFYRMGRA